MELARETERAVAAVQRLLAGRDGRIVVTLVLAATAAIEASMYTPDQPGFPYEGAGDPAGSIFVNLLAVLPLLATARFPFLAAAAASFLTLVILGSAGTTVTMSGLAVLLYAVGNLVARRGLLYSLPLLLPFFVNAIAPFDGRGAGVSSLGPFLLLVAAAAVGESSRKRLEVVTALDATQAAMAESAREQTAMEERAAIARELHDIVAHHLSMIAVQSEAARLTSPRLSADARGRFEAIAATARDALTETRRLLGVLREDVHGEADRAPQPGLDQVAELVDTARDAGSNVRLILAGKVVELPAGVDLAAYRVVQEALTNVLRHAGQAATSVSVEWGDELVIAVSDNGNRRGTSDTARGRGLLGLRERLSLYGGQLDAGPQPSGGWQVRAVMPTGLVT